jgi:hypothetical protein
MTEPSKTNLPNEIRAEQTMTKETLHRGKIIEEVAKFQKTMDELHLLRSVSNDLKNYRRMIRIKQND